MHRKDSYLMMKRILDLIRLKSSGTPKELAEKTGVSERTIYRVIRNIEDIYLVKIEYSYFDNSYVIKNYLEDNSH